ncbi:MAG TPA: hypothetical protein VIP11_13630 [Gemmatimonadaceae bacterium]
MAETILASGLRAAFAEMASRPRQYLLPDELVTLRARMCAVVDDMRADGEPPERVLIAVKQLAADGGVEWTSNRFFTQLVDWCLERYFSIPPRPRTA